MNLSTASQGGITDFDAQEKLKGYGNRKAISSEEFFRSQEEKSEDIKNKYSELKGAKAISSDMMFGNNA